jgi:hypothetical protein
LTRRAALPYGRAHGDDGEIGRVLRANYPPGSLIGGAGIVRLAPARRLKFSAARVILFLAVLSA